MANNALSTHSVQFDSNNVDFDLIAFSDLSGTMTSEFTFKDIFYQKGFTGADSSAVAVIDVSASDYSNLFKLNMPIFDPSSGVVDTDSVRYLPEIRKIERSIGHRHRIKINDRSPDIKGRVTACEGFGTRRFTASRRGLHGCSPVVRTDTVHKTTGY